MKFKFKFERLFSSSKIQKEPTFGEGAKEDTVSEEREHNEVDGGEHSPAHTPRRLNPVVHHRIPVLARQDLEGERCPVVIG